MNKLYDIVLPGGCVRAYFVMFSSLSDIVFKKKEKKVTGSYFMATIRMGTIRMGTIRMDTILLAPSARTFIRVYCRFYRLLNIVNPIIR